MLAPLTPDQRTRYEEEGYLLVSGLIPDATSGEAARAMWGILHMDPGDPATWDAPPPDFEHAVGANRYDLYGIQDPDVMACCTAAFLDAVNNEDRHAVEGAYRGARAPLTTPGPIHPLERAIHHFIIYLAGRLNGGGRALQAAE